MNIEYTTGGAGTGKSHTFNQETEAEERPHIKAAPTGVAAINIGGTTIHKAFSIDVNNNVRDSVYTSVLPGVEVVYLDEGGMISDRLMEAIQEACELVGIDPVFKMFGDLAQLPPVDGSYFFNHTEPSEVRRLVKNYRQNNDAIFADILNNIRGGKVKPNEIKWLNQQASKNRVNVPVLTTLAFRNDTVNEINAVKLAQIDEPPLRLVGKLSGNFTEKDARAPLELVLKEGARVMMLNNDKGERWVNGTAAVVVGFDVVMERNLRTGEETEETVILVKIKGKEYEVRPHRWVKEEPARLTDARRNEYLDFLDWPDNMMYIRRGWDQLKAKKILRTGIDYITMGSFEQYPMKLGFASTVHKAQGQTLDNVHIDPAGFGRSHGLAYVALSRLRTIDGLTLERPFALTDFFFDKKVFPYL